MNLKFNGQDTLINLPSIAYDGTRYSGAQWQKTDKI